MQRLRMRDPSEVSDLIERYITAEPPRLGRRRLHSVGAQPCTATARSSGRCRVSGATSEEESTATEEQHRHDDDE